MKYDRVTYKERTSGMYRPQNTDLQGLIDLIGNVEELSGSSIKSVIEFLKALNNKQGVWCYDDYGEVHFDTIDDIYIYHGNLKFSNSTGDYYVDDYGKTWWLTEKEIPKNDN